jgi:hypothetical protein
MKRRNLLKACIAAPFAGLLKPKTRSGTKYIGSLQYNPRRDQYWVCIPIEDLNKSQIPLDTPIYPIYCSGYGDYELWGVRWNISEIGMKGKMNV